MDNIDRNLTLEELENDFWSEPEFHSHLVLECHASRKVPLKHLTIENLRILIGQEIGLIYLIPIAIEYLEEDPWCSGVYYNGDLLENVFKIRTSFWNDYPDLFFRLSEIMVKMENMSKLYCKTLLPSWDKVSDEFYETQK